MRLFRDDQWMLLSIIPLLIRLALAHVVLKFGTNNTPAAMLNDEEIHRRKIGSQVVLASRVFFVIYIWVQKFCITEFYQRLTTQFWKGLYDLGLKVVRWGLLVTFAVCIISTFVEWQVVPDPGPKCRNGGVPLFVTGVLDIFTDAVLLIFPIPAILYSKMATKRKLQLIALFSLSIVPISVVCGRLPATIEKHYLQPFRTLMASLEILAATFASNALVLSSFLRDKGPKRAKFKSHSTDPGESRAGRSIATVRNRSEAGAAYWGSDEDLVRDTGFALESEAGPTDRVPSRQASNISAQSKKDLPRATPSPTLTRHYSSLGNRPRTTTVSATHPPPPARAATIMTTSNIRASTSNWGFPLDNGSKSNGNGSRGLKLNTDTGIAITTIETRYSPIEPSDIGLGGSGPAFELSPVAVSSSTVTAGPSHTSPRHSIGGGLMPESNGAPRGSSETRVSGGSNADERQPASGTENAASLSFSDVGGLLK
ncbi:hypothetical protein Dda_6763 [Drechslerella dactyloides]|uniref:Rhodopsin domain-containing protein n=1 Tax=Drechslerella dactyloides TaxID=74499 RepID=A0AAD6NJ72_DREDA|nr:hypothetical protein Dda_6763 [Drechslerella dactyloides]